MKRKLALVWLVILTMLPGCLAEMAAHRMIAAPNAANSAQQHIDQPDVSALLDAPYAVTVGPPHATLRFWISEPRPVEIAIAPSRKLIPPPTRTGPNLMVTSFGPTPQGVARGWFQVLRYPAYNHIQPADHAQPVGTVILLHGHSGDLRHNAYLVPWVGVFADAGYRVITLEQRGHGDSTGKWISYGAFESRDLVQVVDELQRQNLIAGPLAVFGHSMGASVAILAAAQDPRIDAVVAVSPFASLREEVRDFAAWRAPWSRWLIHDWFVNRALDAAGRTAGFNPDDADPARAIRHTDTPLLLMHGDNDPIVPVRHSRLIYQARPDHSHLVVFPGADHWSHMKVQFEQFREITLRWLETHLDQPPLPVQTTALQ